MAERDKDYDKRWNNIWEAGLEPGQAFDASAASPALLALIEQGKLEVRGKKVLVPGCGFFCAMEPAMRRKWAQTWSSWLRPGGELVTLMFPVESEGREGPPWPVPVELYDDMLKPEGFTRTYLQQVPPEQCHKGREGKTWIGRWTSTRDEKEQT
ncbi:TPA: hypothetical protein ACH3X2_002391 [Trebouxia sp. C0005]